jgi:CubicO group peptidase (beta-lactamase class C family)
MRWLYVTGFTLFLWASSLEGTVESVLFRLAERSRQSQSDSVLVMHQNKVIFQYHSGTCWQPLETKSITKSMAALAVGLMIDEGKLSSADIPVYQFYPEWDQGNKRLITIRHLLAHTSGLQADDSVDEIYRSCNIIQLALCAELSTQPGAQFSYNNKAINLISGIVKKATGRSLHEYLAIRLFAPLGIENISWLSDSSGNDYAMAHMIITAPDLAKIGQLIGAQGSWCGRSLLSKNWIDCITQPGQSYDPFYGLSWGIEYYNIECYWDDCLLEDYQNAGVNYEFVQRLRSLQGRVVHIGGRTTTPTGRNIFSQEVISLLGGDECADCFYQQVRCLQLPFAKWRIGSIKTITARGDQGQQLIIFPGKNIVAVRQSKGGNDCDTFNDFAALVEELAYRMVEL